MAKDLRPEDIEKVEQHILADAKKTTWKWVMAIGFTGEAFDWVKRDPPGE